MKIVICGAAGRMGRAIVEIAKVDPDIQIVGMIEHNENLAIGSGDPVISSVSDLEKFLSKADALVDFTNSNSTLENLKFAQKCNTPVVVGTTGFDEEQKKRIEESSKAIPIVFSPNMSVGINILFKIVEMVAKQVPDYDIEIVELHHNKKKDSPSGTAAKLAEIAASSIGKNIYDVGVYGRHSSNAARKNGEVGIFSVRAGDIVGDHTVYFVGSAERIELTHRAHSRDTFALGAIRAAKWIVNKKPGLYDMFDVLNLK